MLTMEALAENQEIPFYHRRDPFASPLWKVVDRYYDDFERVYQERYARTYGFWRQVIGDVICKFLLCGDLREGFARVRCVDCGKEYLVPFSCHQRLFCPCCAQKRILELAVHTQEDVCENVPHRQFVFTMPKRLRIFIRYDRELLKELPKLAWEVVKTIYQGVLNRDDVMPGMIATVQTFGELAHWHPHVHTVVTDGVFTSNSTFIPFHEMSVEPFLKLWEKKVFDLLLRKGKITQVTIDRIKCWKHSGFSVHRKVVIERNDAKGLENLIQYIARCPFSLSRMIRITDAGLIIYKTEHGGCHRFPDPASDILKEGVARNFQIFDPLDFLAEVTQHIPKPRVHTIRYFGWYSNKSRGVRGKLNVNQDEIEEVIINCEYTPFRKLCRSRWSALIRKIYEVDPLKCPECGAEMKFVSFIEKRDQAAVIEKILKHCNLWTDPKARVSPGIVSGGDIDFILDPQYIPMDEFSANF